MKRPPLIPTALFLFFVILMSSLGFWQLNRAQQKEQMLQLMSAETQHQLIDETQLETLDKYANVQMLGYFDSRYQFLLDNQFHNKQVGYHVFTPFYLTELDIYIMVNRGWVDKDQSEKIPALSFLPRSIKGRLTFAPQVGYQLGEIEVKDRAQQAITYFEEDKIKSFLSNKLCSTGSCKISHRVLWLDESDPDGYIREWNPVIMGPEKHYGYSVQWFSMTLVLIILFGLWLRKTNKSK